MVASRLLSHISGGLKIKDFVKQTLLHIPDVTSGSQWEAEAIDGALNQNYRVKPLGHKIFGMPDPLIAVAHKASEL
ncbi:MAG: hypothetical protein DDT31_00777 [Syntrophomonadaceae bacterium]|nr:hypothetical protein [Bacillota bacterium]